MKYLVYPGGGAVADPANRVTPKAGVIVHESSPEEDAIPGAKVYDFEAEKLIAEPAKPLSLNDKLRLLLESLPTGTNAKRRAIELAASIKWASENGQASEVPDLIRNFDTGGDLILEAAKSQAIALL